MAIGRRRAGVSRGINARVWLRFSAAVRGCHGSAHCREARDDHARRRRRPRVGVVMFFFYLYIVVVALSPVADAIIYIYLGASVFGSRSKPQLPMVTDSALLQHTLSAPRGKTHTHCEGGL